MFSFTDTNYYKINTYMSCLFNAVATPFPNCDGRCLRARVCAYLKDNARLFDDDVYVVDDTYLATMARSTTWGGAIELKACCNMFNMYIDVRVVNATPPSTIRFAPGICARDTYNHAPHALVVQWNGTHYTFESYGDVMAASRASPRV